MANLPHAAIVSASRKWVSETNMNQCLNGEKKHVVNFTFCLSLVKYKFSVPHPHRMKKDGIMEVHRAPQRDGSTRADSPQETHITQSRRLSPVFLVCFHGINQLWRNASFLLNMLIFISTLTTSTTSETLAQPCHVCIHLKGIC